MLTMKYKTLKPLEFGTAGRTMLQLGEDVVAFVGRIGTEKVVSICEHPEQPIITVWYREEA
jgi:hypothetical protein